MGKGVKWKMCFFKSLFIDTEQLLYAIDFQKERFDHTTREILELYQTRQYLKEQINISKQEIKVLLI